METKQEGNSVVVKLSDGEDLVPSLEAAAQKHRIESGSVVWGIGMLQDFEIGFFGPNGYEKTPFAERHELLALHGSGAICSARRPPWSTRSSSRVSTRSTSIAG